MEYLETIGYKREKFSKQLLYCLKLIILLKFSKQKGKRTVIFVQFLREFVYYHKVKLFFKMFLFLCNHFSRKLKKYIVFPSLLLRKHNYFADWNILYDCKSRFILHSKINGKHFSGFISLGTFQNPVFKARAVFQN